ncbi:cation transporter, partial [Klebsiella pneumoniae]|uniref:cation transporter n=1 Tax=Klebsiella pneumoniae TaxID=573 RepID=UPI001C7192BC
AGTQNNQFAVLGHCFSFAVSSFRILPELSARLRNFDHTGVQTASRSLDCRLNIKTGIKLMQQKIRFQIEGMTCQACASRIEKVLNKKDFVESAGVNFAS